MVEEKNAGVRIERGPDGRTIFAPIHPEIERLKRRVDELETPFRLRLAVLTAENEVLSGLIKELRRRVDALEGRV